MHVSTRARPRPSAKHEVIGYKKRIIIVATGVMDIVMVNPVIIQKSQPFDTEEGCLSLEGTRKAKRFKKIKVKFLDESFKQQPQMFDGWTA